METNLKNGIYCLRLFRRLDDKIQFELLLSPIITKDMLFDVNNFKWESIYMSGEQFNDIKTKEIFLVKVDNNFMEIYDDTELLNKGKMAHKLWENYMVKFWESFEEALKGYG